MFSENGERADHSREKMNMIWNVELHDPLAMPEGFNEDEFFPICST